MSEITRLFSPSRLETGEVLRLSEEEAHHVRKVLRGRSGDRVEVVDTAGRLFVAQLLGGSEATILEERPVAGGKEGEVVLYQAVPKGRHMDLVVEKATELGAGRVVPLSTERGVVRLSEGDGKAQRWRRVAEAAARQSLQLRIPEVAEFMSLPEAVREAGETGVILHNGMDLPPLEEVVVPGGVVGLFVGPEGGFIDGELERAREAGLSLASLGPYRLRSETAGMVAVARACAVVERTRSAGRSL
ncbi:MAG: 16S rRNA (uracil(1498)-N(3))-methyltransferase [Actinomycetota bacterium]|nr:16S rRNA (uracil(1498)-N(3))-methyltransferase [Actinomycetota bacterium]